MLFTRLSSSLPSQCALCRDWGGARLCGVCTRRFAAPVPRCRRCALRLHGSATVCGRCITEPPTWDDAIAAVDYAYPWDGLIPSFKFDGALDLGEALAQRLVDAVSDAPQPDLIVPVPLSAVRLRERGYNQAWELARRVARARSIEADAELLLRVQDRPQQSGLSLAHRVQNVRGSFAVEPLRLARLRGQAVALVDDVMTTGATCSEAARVLREAGAVRVDLWVLARTPDR